MGKLKSALGELQKAVDQATDEQDRLRTALNKTTVSAMMVNDTMQEGISLMAEYVFVKIRKSGKKPSDPEVQKSTLNDYMDAKLKNWLDSLPQISDHAVRLSKEWESCTAAAKKWDASLQLITTYSRQVRNTLDGKKSKLSALKVFRKFELSGYAGTLDEIDRTVDQLRSRVEELMAEDPPDANRIKKISAVNGTTTIAEMESRTGKLSEQVMLEYRKYGDQLSQLESKGPKFRAPHPFHAELKSLETWVVEAKEVEKMMDGKSEEAPGKKA